MSQSVVVVDDDGITLDLLVSIIEDNFDATVYSFTDGRSAKTFIQGQKKEGLTLIISDVIMPGYTGLELLAFIRQQGIDSPMFLMSAQVTKDDAIMAKKYGAAGFLVKPFNRDDLINKIQPFLNQLK